MSKTYNTDSQVGDSAACATALLSGVKTAEGKKLIEGLYNRKVKLSC